MRLFSVILAALGLLLVSGVAAGVKHQEQVTAPAKASQAVPKRPLFRPLARLKARLPFGGALHPSPLQTLRASLFSSGQRREERQRHAQIQGRPQPRAVAFRPTPRQGEGRRPNALDALRLQLELLLMQGR